MGMESFQYDNKIVKAFIIATVVFGVIGMLVGLVIFLFFSSIISELHNNYVYVIVALILSVLIVPGVVAYGICRSFAAGSSDG